MYVSRHHGQTLGQKWLKFGMRFLRIWMSIVEQCGNECGFAIATPTVSYYSQKMLIIDKSSIKFACGLQVPGKELLTSYRCGLAKAITTGNCFGY